MLEVAVVGDPEDPATGELLAVVREAYRPRLAVAAGLPSEPPGRPLALLAARETRDGRPAAYVCRDYACREPVTDVESLRARLTEAWSER
jgi:hypothetical protein